MADFERLRQTMVDNQLRTSGITDHRLLLAMSEIPRERFVSGPRHMLAYIDEAQPMSATRLMAAPAPFARLVQLAAIEHTDRVLDVGCGSGYSTAVIARLARQVVGAEEDGELATRARSTLAGLGIANAEIVAGAPGSSTEPGTLYDVIVVEGAVAVVPPEVLRLLKPEGRLVAAIGTGRRPAVAHLFVKSGSGVAASPAFDAGLPPLSPSADQGFVF